VKRTSGVSAALLLATALAGAPARGAESVWYVGATIHSLEAPAIPNGTLEVADGKIVRVGTATAPPAGARLVDLTGKRIYPGFVHPAVTIGLTEIGSVRGSVDTTEIGANNAHLRAEVAFNADSLLLLPAMGGGVLTAHVTPAGGTVSPASAVMRLDGWNWREMTLRSRAAHFLDYPEVALSDPGADAKAKDEFERKKRERLAELDSIFDRARAWATAKSAFDGAKSSTPVAHDAPSEALAPVLSGESPLFVRARERRQIAAALDWVAARKIPRVVLVSGADAVDHAARLASAGIPVLLEEVLTLPARRTDPYDAPYAAAGRLHAAGVEVAIGDGGDAANARNLPFQAAMAVAFGLPADAALRAITIVPAELTGVADRVGSLAPGKEATFFVADGDPLEITTAIERVFVRGQEIDLERDRQRQLWRRYSARPKAAVEGPAELSRERPTRKAPGASGSRR
jgi:imidazolonepropionase-like amidohydrolase